MAKLLTVNNYHYLRGGSETVFFQEADLLRESGWDVAAFSMDHPQNLPSEWSEYFIDELEIGNIRGAKDKLIGAAKSIYSFEAKSKIKQMMARFQPDICHAHNIYHHISPAILPVVRQQGVPVVITLHDLKIACPTHSMMNHKGVCEECKGGKNYRALVNRCAKGSAMISGVVMMESYVHKLLQSYRNNVDRFVVPSQFYLDKFVEWGWERERFVHIPNFVSTEGKLPAYGEGDYYFYFGRLTDQKGVDTFVQAAAEAGVKAKIAGEGPEMARLEALATKLSADVEFLGYLTGDALVDAIRGAKAVVQPSKGYENAPMSLMEAYMYGKPVIGSRIGGIPELIREAETGYSFTPGNADDLAGKLREMEAHSMDDVGQMGRVAREWIERDFNAATHLAALQALYAELGVRA